MSVLPGDTDFENLIPEVAAGLFHYMRGKLDEEQDACMVLKFLPTNCILVAKGGERSNYRVGKSGSVFG